MKRSNLSYLIGVIVVIQTLVILSQADGYGVSNCWSCPYYCYPCKSGAYAYCTNEWTLNSVCCSAITGIRDSYTKCTGGSNCCSVTNKILIGVGVAAGVVVVIAIVIIFICIRRARRRALENGGFSEVVVHQHHQPQAVQVIQTTSYGTTAQVGYQAAPVGYPAPAQPGYQVY